VRRRLKKSFCLRSSISQCKGDDTYHDAYVTCIALRICDKKHVKRDTCDNDFFLQCLLNILCNNSSLICLLQAHVCHCREERFSIRCGGVLCPFGCFGVCSIMFVSCHLRLLTFVLATGKAKSQNCLSTSICTLEVPQKTIPNLST
jgi:hypothetical protein